MKGASVALYVLEHDPVIERNVLQGLSDWRADERSRMEKFVDKSALASFCLARVLARMAIKEATGTDVDDIEFRYGANGKPFLPWPAPRFNWSHSSGCVLLAVSQDAEVGADIEAFERKGGDFLDMADRFFRAEEAEWVRSGAEGSARTRFLSLFVQKEAYLKMTGTGLSGSLADAPAAMRLPPFGTDHEILFLSGRDCVGAACVDGAVQGFEFHRSRFESERGIEPLSEWVRLT